MVPRCTDCGWHGLGELLSYCHVRTRSPRCTAEERASSLEPDPSSPGRDECEDNTLTSLFFRHDHSCLFLMLDSLLFSTESHGMSHTDLPAVMRRAMVSHLLVDRTNRGVGDGCGNMRQRTQDDARIIPNIVDAVVGRILACDESVFPTTRLWVTCEALGCRHLGQDASREELLEFVSGLFVRVGEPSCETSVHFDKESSEDVRALAVLFGRPCPDGVDHTVMRLLAVHGMAHACTNKGSPTFLILITVS